MPINTSSQAKDPPLDELVGRVGGGGEITVMVTVALAVAPRGSLTVISKVSVPVAAGAVKLGVKVSALLSTTSLPAV